MWSPGRGEERWPRRLLVAGISCLIVALPFLAITFPPVTDLAQHVAQIRLLHEALADPGGPYRVQWLTPYSLGYWVLAGAWEVTGPPAAGWLGLLAIAVLWVAAVHLLAAARERPAGAAAIASLLCFSHVFYWGFLGFAVGWVVFVPWFLLTTRRAARPFRWSDAPLYLGGAMLLYLAHALWLGAGVLWFLITSASQRTPPRAVTLRFLSLAPVLAIAAAWYQGLSATGFASPTRWSVTPTGRLSFSWLVDSILGGLHGPAEWFAIGGLGLWIAAGLWQHRHRLSAAMDGQLALAAAMFLVIALLVPDLHTNTIQLSARWMPAAMVAGLLAVLAPIPAPARRDVLALGFLLAFAAITALSWVRFEREELDGLAESLRALPPHSRVIGLDLVKRSQIVKGRPFLQTFAYAQVLGGGQLNFSFADFAPSLVVYRERRRPPWTPGLEWYAERVQPADLHHFDYALVHGDESVHEITRTRMGLAPVTSTGSWRLYRALARPS